MAFDFRSFAGSPHHAAGGIHPIFIRIDSRAAIVHRIRAAVGGSSIRRLPQILSIQSIDGGKPC
jgi:hypothetical protein